MNRGQGYQTTAGGRLKKASRLWARIGREGPVWRWLKSVASGYSRIGEGMARLGECVVGRGR